MRNLKVFTTSKLPKDMELMGTVANGYIGTTLFDGAVYISGVFNGKTITSHRAIIPCTLPTYVEFEENPGYSRIYSLNVAQGVFVQEVSDKARSFVIYQRTYAHRTIPGVMITEFTCENKGSKVVRFQANVPGELTSDDLDITNRQFKDYSLLVGVTKEAERDDSSKTEVAVVWSPGKLSSNISIEPNTSQKRLIYISSYASSLDTDNPVQKATETYTKVQNLWKENPDQLFEQHKTAWSNLWSSASIDVEGDDVLAQAIYGSLYYIISSIRDDWPYGLSPGGLASNGYMGHTFWDQDTWMYPPLLLLHNNLARSALQYRIDRIKSARTRAINNGFKGTMFPWESALTGFEVCPAPDPYSKYEHHVTGDVGFAAQQYWMATHDTEWLMEKGKLLIEGVAEFWASRVTYIKDKDVYFIEHVQGPDEYEYDVANSVFTNVVAKINLEFAFELFNAHGIPSRSEWKTISEKMYIPYDKAHDYHPEYDGYTLDTTVKQADVILLGFPLMYQMPTTTRRNDVSIYEPRTDPDGPAMTKSMFAVNWLDVGDEKEASRAFKEGYANVQEPFKVWTETPQGGEINFITGAGGFLQSVIFGYGGVRLTLNGLSLYPRFPGNAKALALRGLKYLGNCIDVEAVDATMKITLRSTYGQHFQLLVRSLKTGKPVKLTMGTPLTLQREPVVITKE